MADVPAAFAWPTNGHLIEAVASLRYLRDSDTVLDPTYGNGTFWARWRPAHLIVGDIEPKQDWIPNADFRSIDMADCYVDAVTFDPPYKLNGTASGPMDDRYGVHVKSTWQARHALIRSGIDECARVCKRTLLIKCQDQVSSGQVRWQTREFAAYAEACGFRLVDMFHVLGGRKQPEGRRQVHARRNYSTLLVLERKGVKSE